MDADDDLERLAVHDSNPRLDVGRTLVGRFREPVLVWKITAKSKAKNILGGPRPNIQTCKVL